MVRCVPSLKRHYLFAQMLRAVSLFRDKVYPHDKSLRIPPNTSESAARILEEATRQALSLAEDLHKVRSLGISDGSYATGDIAHDTHIARRLLTAIEEGM